MAIIKKIRLGIIMGFILSVVLTFTVRADIIWEPTDSFYKAHREECKELYRSYIANGEDGYVALYKAPDSSEKVKLYENGYKFTFWYSYVDKKGKEWGLFEPGETGWIPMDEVLLKYDNISFCEEYEAEFGEYNGEYEEELANNVITLWSYPCSGETQGQLPEINQNIKIYYTYTDQDDNVWGLLGYAELVQRNDSSKWSKYSGWVCLNDPDKVSFPVVDHQTDTIPASKVLPSLDEVNRQSNMTFLLIGALTFVIVLTVGIIIRMKMKKQK